jgi:hypothetical protein
MGLFKRNGKAKNENKAFSAVSAMTDEKLLLKGVRESGSRDVRELAENILGGHDWREQGEPCLYKCSRLRADRKAS